MNLSLLEAITPQLIIAGGIVLSLLLISYRRSKSTIASFTLLVVMISGFSALYLLVLKPISPVTANLVYVDRLSLVGFLLLAFAMLAVIYNSLAVLRNDIEVHDEYYLLLLLVFLGASTLLVSNHYVTLFLGFEILSISLVGLVAYFRQQPHSVEVGFKYLILSASASSFMLLGIAFIYSHTGQLNFDLTLLSDQVGGVVVVAGERFYLFEIGILLLFSGLAFKLSLVPFHLWTPDVYQGAKTPITLLLATVSKVAIFVVMVRLCYAGNKILPLPEGTISILSVVAISSMLMGNILALRQVNFKRILAYSSIAHMGYISIVIFSPYIQQHELALEVALLYFSAYFTSSIVLFTTINKIECANNNGSEVNISHLTGLFWQNPISALVIIFAILSLAGIPLTFGFIGKFYLVTFATENHMWWLLSSLIVGSGVSLAYYLPMIMTLFNREPQSHQLSKSAAKLILSKPFSLTFMLLLIGLGVWPNVVFDFVGG